jgi:hypothetical protein
VSITLFGQKRQPLTPELVIDGGYFNYERTDLFGDKIEDSFDYQISYDDLKKNIAAYIFLNNYRIVMEKDGQYVFWAEKIPVGTETLSTYIGSFNRLKGTISFMVSMSFSDGVCKYEISDVQISRRLKRIGAKYLACATNADIKNLKDFGFEINTITVLGIDLPTNGSPNDIHYKRIAGLVAERNGYVNFIIKEGKTTRGLKSSWVDKIKKMDANIYSEMQLYKDEYTGITDFIKNVNEKITKE